MGKRRDFPGNGRGDAQGGELGQRVQFGEFAFDADSGQLWHGADELRLTPKAAAVLHLLIDHAGTPVSRQQLFATVWSGTIVTDDALASCIQELRKALGDDPRQPRYIETRHRVGYRFVGPVIAAPANDERSAAQHDAPSIAVLPFTDISPARDNGYFCDGLAVELTSRLAQLPGLRVVSRTAAFQFRDVGADVRAVGRQLGARYLLEGSIRKGSEALHVAVQLIDAGTGYHAWSRQFDRAPADVFAIQDEIIAGVNLVLQGVELDEAQKQRIAAPPTHAAAYDYYLRGLQYLPRMTEAGLRQGAAMFEQALGLDPAYGPAHAGLATVFATLHEWFGARPENLARAMEASRQAVALAPQLAEAHVARGFALAQSRSFAEASNEFNEAIRLNPQLFEACYYFARASFARGENELAAEMFRRAAELRREDFQSPILRAQALRMLGQHDEAVLCDREGARRAERALALNPADARALSLGAHGLLHTGEVERARQWVRRAVELHADDACAVMNSALVHALLGEKERALELLECAFGQGWGKRAWIERDPDYDTLRDEPRFQKLIARLG